MAGNPSSLPLYIGTIAIANPGDPAPEGVRTRSDRGRALADAWAEARETGRVPHVYEVSKGTIRTEVLPSGAMAWAALTARRGQEAASAPDGGPV